MYSVQQHAPPPQPGVTNTAMLYNAAGQPVAVTLPSLVSVYDKYNSKQSMVTGVVLVIAGVLAIVFNIAAIAREEVLSYVGFGFWCGILFIIGGAFGIGAKAKNRCMVVAYLVLAIIAASFAAVMFSLAVPGAVVGVEDWYNDRKEAGVLCAIMAVVAVVAAVAAIWGSVLGCKVTCCGRQTTGMVVGGSQQVVVFTQQPQQPYYTVPQIDPLARTNVPLAPPTYTSSVGYPAGVHPPPQLPASQMNPAQATGYYPGPGYNAGHAAASAPPPTVYQGNTVVPPIKM